VPDDVDTAIHSLRILGWPSNLLLVGRGKDA
jgi:hypothetical protein